MRTPKGFKADIQTLGFLEAVLRGSNAVTAEHASRLTVALETFEEFGVVLEATKRDGGRAEIRVSTIDLEDGQPTRTYFGTLRRSETDHTLQLFKGEDF